MLESIEKLCKWRKDNTWCDGLIHLVAMQRELETEEFDEIVEAIQREVDEQYMKLPADADGVPIRVGDKVETFDCPSQDYEKFTVYGFTTTTSDGGDWYVIDGHDQQWYAKTLRHAKPNAIEDVLREFAKSGTPTGDGGVLFETALIEKYADELRELLGGEK